jgi:hypothetical protein
MSSSNGRPRCLASVKIPPTCAPWKNGPIRAVCCHCCTAASRSSTTQEIWLYCIATTTSSPSVCVHHPEPSRPPAAPGSQSARRDTSRSTDGIRSFYLLLECSCSPVHPGPRPSPGGFRTGRSGLWRQSGLHLRRRSRSARRIGVFSATPPAAVLAATFRFRLPRATHGYVTRTAVWPPKPIPGSRARSSGQAVFRRRVLPASPTDSASDHPCTVDEPAEM